MYWEDDELTQFSAPQLCPRGWQNLAEFGSDSVCTLVSVRMNIHKDTYSGLSNLMAKATKLPRSKTKLVQKPLGKIQG